MLNASKMQNGIFYRVGRKITVAVDDHVPLTTTAPAGSEQLNVYEALYIGKQMARI